MNLHFRYPTTAHHHPPPLPLFLNAAFVHQGSEMFWCVFANTKQRECNESIVSSTIDTRPLCLKAFGTEMKSCCQFPQCFNSTLSLLFWSHKFFSSMFTVWVFFEESDGRRGRGHFPTCEIWEQGKQGEASVRSSHQLGVDTFCTCWLSCYEDEWAEASPYPAD